MPITGAIPNNLPGLVVAFLVLAALALFSGVFAKRYRPVGFVMAVVFAALACVQFIGS